MASEFDADPAAGELRISVDIGGTFTDMVLEAPSGLHLYKAPTVPDDPMQGVIDVVGVAATALGSTVADLLGRTAQFIHATTRGLNAVLTRTTSRTALLTTAGHPDVLLLREGGREDPFDFTVPYPDPYVPRSLTWEVPERITSTGDVLTQIDHGAVERICDELVAHSVEAVAVCLLWSTINPVHELTVGEIVGRRLPDVPVTLSHQLNPSLREYRRASSAAIDASLKPIMTKYVAGLTARLADAGFDGRVLMVTSMGGVVDADAVAAAPLQSINSGPSMAPVAGRAYALRDSGADAAIVADAGGTTYDVTLVRNGRIPWTREAWIGPRITGHMTGLPSIDVKSVGAGGGSIAWVDPGGLLHVGPQSAGSVPGPACYGRGGTEPTLTDAALVLGYLDPDQFSGGAMPLDLDAAVEAVRTEVGEPLGLDDVAAADAIMRLTTEQMVRAIEEITLQQGIDPAGSVLVGGGGAAGLNAVWVAQRLGCRQLLIPVVGAALAAAGALMSDLTAAYAATVPTTTSDFDRDRVNAALSDLERRCLDFIAESGIDPADATIQLFGEARYPQQIWELEVPIASPRFDGDADVAAFADAFHAVHEQVLGIADTASGVEVVSWGARVRCPLPGGDQGFPRAAAVEVSGPARRTRPAYFPATGVVATTVQALDAMAVDETLAGPAIVESSFTTVVVPPGSACTRTATGSLSITAGRDADVASISGQHQEMAVR